MICSSNNACCCVLRLVDCVVFIIQVMYLGVVAKPEPNRNFDGKIFLKRVSEEVEYKKKTHNQNFSDDACINGQLKDGEWMTMHTEGMTLGELKDCIAMNWFLDEFIRDRMVVLKYYIPGSKEGERTAKYIDDDDTVLDSDLLNGTTLMVRYNGPQNGQPGDKREVDVSCDSKFMKNTMPEVGKAIREAYHWVDINTPIFLYLDNAGGHGTKEVVDAYVKALEEDWNVICVHQRPRSPCTKSGWLCRVLLRRCIFVRECKLKHWPILLKLHGRNSSQSNSPMSTTDGKWYLI